MSTDHICTFQTHREQGMNSGNLLSIASRWLQTVCANYVSESVLYHLDFASKRTLTYICTNVRKMYYIGITYKKCSFLANVKDFKIHSDSNRIEGHVKSIDCECQNMKVHMVEVIFIRAIILVSIRMTSDLAWEFLVQVGKLRINGLSVFDFL